MSSLLSLVGGGIKSIQRGSSSVSQGATVNITISAVNLDKTVLIFNAKSGSDYSYNCQTPGAALTTSTNLAIYGGDTGSPNPQKTAQTGYYQVIEYY